MSTKNRILANALATAGVLAFVGYLYAQLAGMWMSTQQVQRTVLAEAPIVKVEDTAVQVSQTLMWRLPITLAAMGFVFVLVGESLVNLWKQPSPVATKDSTPSSWPSTQDTMCSQNTMSDEAEQIAASKEAEAMMQQLLKQAERDPLMTPPPRGGLKLDLSKIQTLDHAQ